LILNLIKEANLGYFSSKLSLSINILPYTANNIVTRQVNINIQLLILITKQISVIDKLDK
jgi:hypothetical protein